MIYPSELVILSASGLCAGVLAGFLGIGGGVILVPLLVALNYSPVQAVATSSLSILITALSGSFHNRRMGYISFNRVLGIGIPALLTAQLGAYLANQFSQRSLLIAFGCLLLLNIFLVRLKQIILRRSAAAETTSPTSSFNPVISRILTGGIAGFLAGLLGVGGGVIMVPLQVLLLNERIKTAVQTSLGVIVMTSFSACLGHAQAGNVLWIAGFLLGFGGLIGVQLSARFLPKLPEKVITLAFQLLLGILAIYVFVQAKGLQ
ncbi:MAG: sulfite exporter TauE/SafE family protein [Microcoleaceae cyanobacterium]